MDTHFHSRIFGPHDVAFFVTYCLRSSAFAAELSSRENWMCFSIAVFDDMFVLLAGLCLGGRPSYEQLEGSIGIKI